LGCSIPCRNGEAKSGKGCTKSSGEPSSGQSRRETRTCVQNVALTYRLDDSVVVQSLKKETEKETTEPACGKLGRLVEYYADAAPGYTGSSASQQIKTFDLRVTET
jgi:hypothetical protein